MDELDEFHKLPSGFSVKLLLRGREDLGKH